MNRSDRCSIGMKEGNLIPPKLTESLQSEGLYKQCGKRQMQYGTVIGTI